MPEHRDDFDLDHDHAYDDEGRHGLNFNHGHDDEHRHDRELPPTLLDSTVDVTATDGNGHVLSGSGNPAVGWEIQNNGSFQLATDVHYRQGDTVQPAAVDDDGVLIYNMPAGPQVADAAHGVPVDNPNRAAASFDYSFDTGVGPGPHQTIEDFLGSGGEFVFKIDLDPSQHNDPLVLHAVYDASINTGGSHVVWEDAHNHVVIADDAGTDYVTQNSQNYAFYQALIDTDPHTHGIQPGPVGVAGIFNIEEQIIAPHHNVIADIRSELDIGTPGGTSEHHEHNEPPPTQLDATVDVTATDGSGHVLSGSGNPADGWEIQNNDSFQLATDVHYRQGDTVQPAAVDDDGVLIYNMPAGPQVADAAHGVPVDNPNRAAASFDYSFDTGVGPGPHQTIEDFLGSGGEFVFKIDLDPSQHNDPLVLHAVYDASINTGGSHVVWEDAHNHVVIADDAGTDYVTQNSQNYAFYQSLIDTDPHTHGIQTGPVGVAGTFDIEEQIIASHHQLVADIHSALILA